MVNKTPEEEEAYTETLLDSIPNPDYYEKESQLTHSDNQVEDIINS